MGSKIFISYRREDSADVTGRIYDYLIQPIGPFQAADVFKDVDSIPFGVDFKKHIEAMVQESTVALVVIGPKWLTATNNTGQRRLGDPRDFVRIEVEVALQRGIPVIPLLIMNAVMPAPEDLPEGIRDIAYRNGIEIRRDPDFKTDMGRLNKSLQSWIEVPDGNNKPAQKSQLLITYNRKNEQASEIARTLNTHLKEDGYTTWIDFEQMKKWKTGNWNDAIEQIIFDSSVLIAIYTEEQLESRYFNHELQIARNIRVPIIIVLPPRIKVPESLEGKAFAVINARTNNNWYGNLLKLFDRVESPPKRANSSQ